jgi:hypothetical protein
MNAGYSGEVQLEGKALTRARTAETEILSNLDEMASLIVEAMEGSSERAPSVERVSVAQTHGAHVFVYHGPEYCYVYDGNVGICRPCTPQEEKQ